MGKARSGLHDPPSAAPLPTLQTFRTTNTAAELGHRIKQAVPQIFRARALRQQKEGKRARDVMPDNYGRESSHARLGDLPRGKAIGSKIDRAELRSPEIKTARVVGYGPTRRAAFHAIRDLIAKYPRHAVRFTGVCTEPLSRPSLVIDDETLELLRS